MSKKVFEIVDRKHWDSPISIEPSKGGHCRIFQMILLFSVHSWVDSEYQKFVIDKRDGDLGFLRWYDWLSFSVCGLPAKFFMRFSKVPWMNEVLSFPFLHARGALAVVRVDYW